MAHRHSSSEAPEHIWTPKSYDELDSIERDKFLQWHDKEHPGRKIVRTQPGVVIKYFGNLAEEVLCSLYAYEELKLPVPRILHYPGDPYERIPWKLPLPSDPPRPYSVWYICMEEVSGVSLDRVVDTMTPEEIEDIASQLQHILSKMAEVKSTTLGSITGESYRNEFWPPWRDPPTHAFSSTSEFINYHRQLLGYAFPPHMCDDFVRDLPVNSPVRFAHGDLLPKNIMVSGSKIAAIVDWATAGFYPEFWEYARMHDPAFITPGWRQVLECLYPEPRRDKEIVALRRMFDLIYVNL